MQNAALYDTMTRAMKAGTGIRILHQEPFETLISFITSQNNNIPRIRSLIARLCRELGNGFESPYGETVYAFPTAEAVASAGEKALLDMKFGFRAKYIARCAETVASGRFDLSSVSGLRDDEARMELMTLYGVGPKVANCVLLFGYARKDMFPVDVWIKRAINTRFGGTLPDFGAYAGIAQQYIFNNERNEI
ncbi:hypothetical protein SDC9_135352 [bioreactor metagenome]|uniref:DNA-(apurinic or apyrimidinic site) lyase n=1 Tax=bioreactor metagenome TaxID=1076179 RepID=A0A645DG78_9ZZZZ